MLSSANSFLQHYKDPIRIHILHNNPDTLNEISSFLKKFENLISITKYKFIKSENFTFPAIENYHVTEATYYRLFLHQYLPKNISKLLYLDPDVITISEVTKVVQKQFNELKNSKYSIGGVNYALSSNSANQKMFDRLSIKSKKYFNAGVLFIDYKKWQSFEIGRNLISHSKEIVSSNVELKQHDQDVLNSYFDGKFLELDYIYNYPILERFYKQDKIKIEKNVFFIHYVGKEKPWLLNGVFSKSAKYYQNSYKDYNDGIHFEVKNDINFKKIIKKYRLRNLFNLTQLTNLVKVLKKYIFK
jgi:lipopolysaccharide biosynthesis glycosyltransferase